MTDQDKQIAPQRTRGDAEAPEREPWTQRDAKAMHVVDLGWRLIIGAVAGLGGGVLLFILVRGAHELADKGAFTTDDLQAIGGCAVLGGMMAAFAIGQVLQLLWVGGDQGFDARLWGSLTSRERGLWRLREGSSGPWTFLLFVAITLAAFLYADAVLARLLWQEALAGRWLPAAAAVLSTATLVGLLLYLYSRNARRARAVSNAVWVSQGRWVIKGYWPTRRNALILVAASVPFLTAGHFLERTRLAVSCIGLGLVLLIAGFAMLRGALRYRRYGPPELEVVREVDRPLVLACKASLPLSAEEAERGRWLAKFQAFGSKTGGGSYANITHVWLETSAAVVFEKGSAKASFTLEIDMPGIIPVPSPHWMIRVVNASGNRSIDFLLPREILLTEEYPAS